MYADNYEQANSLVAVDVNGLVANGVACFHRVPPNRSIVNRIYTLWHRTKERGYTVIAFESD